ncbi:hypothetical protein JW859_00680 [bacterium]|nr:hypothetical protein [bacterium]
MLIWAAEVLVGAGLVVGCIRGLLTQADVYDVYSSRWMNSVQVLGIFLGLLLLGHAFGLIRIPLPGPLCGG